MAKPKLQPSPSTIFQQGIKPIILGLVSTTHDPIVNEPEEKQTERPSVKDGRRATKTNPNPGRKAWVFLFPGPVYYICTPVAWDQASMIFLGCKPILLCKDEYLILKQGG
jgi:hypothetical protein